MRIEFLSPSHDEWVAVIQTGHMAAKPNDPFSIKADVTGLNTDGDQITYRIILTKNEIELLHRLATL